MNQHTLAKIFIVSLFIPGEFHLKLGDLRLEAYRIVLAISFVKGFQSVLRMRNRLEITDKCIIIATLWGSLTLLLNHGLTDGIEKSGIFTLEIFGSYFLARFGLNSEKKLIATYKLLSFMVMLFLIPTLIEMLTGRKIIHELAQAMTGKNILSPALYTEVYSRMGMMRSTSAFSHPILNGTICVAAIPFAFYMYLKTKKLKHFTVLC